VFVFEYFLLFSVSFLCRSLCCQK